MIHLNASDDRGIDIIRNQINSFVNSKTLFSSGTKFVILDEVDYMTKNAQQALKYLMQEYNEVVSYDWNKLFPNWNASQAAADTTVLWPNNRINNFPDWFNSHETKVYRVTIQFDVKEYKKNPYSATWKDEIKFKLNKPTYVVIMYYDENGVYCFNKILGTKSARLKEYRVQTRVLFYPTGNYSWDLIIQ